VWSSRRWGPPGLVDPRRILQMANNKKSPTVDLNHLLRSCSVIIVVERISGGTALN